LTEHRSINAVAESFFATLRSELVDHERYATNDAATLSIGEYIDNFYNIERRHSFLGYLNPSNSNCVPVPFDDWHSQPVYGNGGSSVRD
jgi:transposase InsO family protein